MLIKKHQYLAFVLPAVFFILLIIVVPFLIGIYYSLPIPMVYALLLLVGKTLKSFFKTPPFCRVLANS